MAFEPVWWEDEGRPAVGYLDQRFLPHDIVRSRAHDIDELVGAITTLAVRGAPAIGVFGAYGTVLARLTNPGDADFETVLQRLRAARPTAVNLSWAIERVRAEGATLESAQAVHDEQRAVDRAIGRHGAELLPVRGAVLTHCNTGPLATAGFGTALGVIIAAHESGKQLHVYVDETRPLLQGSRLTTLELADAGVPSTLIVDAAAAATMVRKDVRAVVVGADRIATNGDTANKIGTFGLALAAAQLGIPFYVAAPRSTIDFALRDGAAIVIEERNPDEVRAFGGRATAPPHVTVFNPAFDVTPGRLIAGIVTEYGVARPPYAESLADLATRPDFSALAAFAR
ncbi:MAG: S-methyl-5-thioribose-1-phosphate isomerase [Candidatus Eremiobacteraeota bacterium]|nr:S-methyl-5-thioribose-1-phosphate isomerase [Candidatus Eremiobacteraeota bacterium]